ncbi:MAG: phosphatase PAP2 family protein, partial [Sphingomonas sp.]
VLCYLILVAISSLIGAFFPSEGAYVAFAVDPAALAHVDGKFGHFFLAAFHAVRTEPAFLLSFANVAGILTFPSVHAGVAALCAWAAWPSRPLRLPILTLNILMAIGTLPYGAHFLIDVLAGGAVAWLAVHLSGQLIRFFGRRAPTIDTEPLPAGAA